MRVPGQLAARQQWVEEETDFVPFPRGLQEAQDLPGHWTPGTQQLPKQPGSLRKLQWFWFTLRERQAQALPLGLSWRLMTLIWSESFIRWPKCPHRHCHLVMHHEIKGRPPWFPCGAVLSSGCQFVVEALNSLPDLTCKQRCAVIPSASS